MLAPMVGSRDCSGDGGTDTGHSHFENPENFSRPDDSMSEYFNLNNLNNIIEDNFVTSEDDDDDDDFGGLYFPRLNKFNTIDYKYYTIDKYNSFCSNMHNKSASLKIIHFNIVGLNNNFDNLMLYLNTLQFHFDIICLSETHVNTKKYNQNQYTMEGYDNCYVASNISYALMGVVLSMLDVAWVPP